MIHLPDYARVDRSLEAGLHPYEALLPRVRESPALARITPDPDVQVRLLDAARVQVRDGRGFAFIDVETPCIVLSTWYYRKGGGLDLYLDLLHEVTHLRQLAEGHDLWDERFAYVDRPTEVEGYAVAVEEGRRLGMDTADVLQHLSNPWMTAADVERLVFNVDAFLDRGQLPTTEVPAPAVRPAWRPW